MPSRKGSHDIASNVRGAFLRACKSLEDKGRPLSTIIEEMLAEKPREALDTVAKFVPKEMLIETTVIQQLEELGEEALDSEIRRLAAQASALPAPEGAGESTQH